MKHSVLHRLKDFFFQLLDAWAASQITSDKSVLSVKRDMFTRDKYILFFLISSV